MSFASNYACYTNKTSLGLIVLPHILEHGYTKKDKTNIKNKSRNSVERTIAAFVFDVKQILVSTFFCFQNICVKSA
jgi:hypothetical protein